MRRAAFACIMAAASSAAIAQSYKRTDTGIIVTPASGPAVELQSYGDGIIRVTQAGPITVAAPPSLMVRAKPVSDGFTVSETPGTVTLSTVGAFADVNLATGTVRFRNAAGQAVLEQSGSPSFKPVTAEGAPWLTISQQFNRGTDEGFYGLGQHQFGQMNYNGEDVELAQHNMDVAIPFVVSTRNYGLLWDNNSVTRFGDPEPYTDRKSVV